MGLNSTEDPLRDYVAHSVELSFQKSEEIGAISTNACPPLIGSHSEGIKFPGTSALPST